MSMSDHAKPLSRFVQDARERRSELEAIINRMELELTKAKTEHKLMVDITTNAESFLNLTNAASGGQSAISVPETMKR